MAIQTFIAVGLVSLISVVGVFSIFVGLKRLEFVAFGMVGLAAGTLLGDAILHILPELYSETEQPMVVSISVLAGILFFLILEKLLSWHHHHDSDHKHELSKAIGWNNLIADALHNFVDGIVIAAGFAISPEIGVATTLAVAMHELPQEVSDFGILIAAGFSTKNALLFNLISALAAVMGAASFFLFTGIEQVADILIGVAAGAFIYIALVDLVPRLKKKDRKSTTIQILTVVLGIGIMFILSLVE